MYVLSKSEYVCGRKKVEKVIYKKPKGVQKKNVVEPEDTLTEINDTLIYFENEDTLNHWQFP